MTATNDKASAFRRVPEGTGFFQGFLSKAGLVK